MELIINLCRFKFLLTSASPACGSWVRNMWNCANKRTKDYDKGKGGAPKTPTF